MGPLPDPQTIAGYENALSGGADRIFKMAEREQLHRHAISSKQQTLTATSIMLGQLCALIMGLSGIGGGVFLVSKDKPITGFSIFFTSLAALCGVYFVNRKKQAKDSN
jgi:uncharacterized membrane protein